MKIPGRRLECFILLVWLYAGCLSSHLCGREISSPYINELGILHQFSIAYPVSTLVLCNNSGSFLFCSVPGFIPSLGRSNMIITDLFKGLVVLLLFGFI